MSPPLFHDQKYQKSYENIDFFVNFEPVISWLLKLRKIHIFELFVMEPKISLVENRKAFVWGTLINNWMFVKLSWAYMQCKGNHRWIFVQNDLRISRTARSRSIKDTQPNIRWSRKHGWSAQGLSSTDKKQVSTRKFLSLRCSYYPFGIVSKSIAQSRLMKDALEHV